MSTNKIKICLLAIIMMLGTTVIADESVSGAESVVSRTDEQIKANKETFEKAQEAISKKDYQSAIVYLTAYISSKSKKYEAYKLRGEAFYALRQYKLASIDFQTAIDLKAADDKLVTGTKVLGAMVLGADKQSQYQNTELGNLYGELMYAQKALNLPAYETSYKKAVEYNSHIYLPQPKKEDIAKINYPQKYGKILNPQGDDTYIYGAIDDIENGKYHDAVFKTQYLMSNYPKYYLGYYLSGVAFAGMEQDEDAVVAFEGALKNNPYDFESFASLGQIYYNKAEKTFSKEDCAKSVEYFQKALKYNPNCYLYYYYIGLNHMITGDYDSAIASFNSAIKFKSNDYNSMYYKLVAQHIKGDYESVISGATYLLYRHVSNYNSVLYLRALAAYKSGNINNAIEDIEKIHNNMNDIYNADIRIVSKKEKNLPNYLYYLKAQILKEKGFGVKADLAKAYENPIIQELSKGGSLSNSDLNLSTEDVEYQYDYIRTTFNDLGVTFTYLNPYYKLAVLKPVEKVTDDKNIQNEPVLKTETNQLETLAMDNQTSIAQVLASQSLYQEKPVEILTESESHIKQDTVVEEKTETVAEILQPEVSENEVEKVVEPELVAETQEQVNVIESHDDENESEAQESMKFVADEIKDTPDFKITYENVPSVVDSIDSKTETTIETHAENSSLDEVEQVKEDISEPVKIVEKHADVNLSEFNINPQKTLEIQEDDEVIELEPESLIAKIEEQKSEKVTEEKVSQESIIEKAIDVNVTKDEMTVSEAVPDIVDIEIPETSETDAAEAVAKTDIEVEDNTIIENAVSEVSDNNSESENIKQEQKTTELNITKQKKHKAKKDMDLQEFLAPSVKMSEEKNVKDKKKQDLEDFFEGSEVAAVSQEDKPKKVKKSRKKIEKEILKDMESEEMPTSTEEIKSAKEKRVWFWQKKEKSDGVAIDSESNVDDIVEAHSEIVQEELKVNKKEPQQIVKTKKSWFYFLKRKKKSEVLEKESGDLTVTTEDIEKEANLGDIPYLRLDKEDVDVADDKKVSESKNSKRHRLFKKEIQKDNIDAEPVFEVPLVIEEQTSTKKVIKQMNH